MKIMEANRKDLPEIFVVQKMAFYAVGKFYNNFRIHPLIVGIDELEMDFHKYTYFKVMEEKSIIASARTYMEADCCKIENVIVLPYYQKRGIGKKLMTFIEDKYNNCASFELFTGKASPGNVEFYLKQGYKIISEINPTETEPRLVVMRKMKKGA
jgi:N-acetylglutamate synthase-like GNAT family acetyltransferase